MGNVRIGCAIVIGAAALLVVAGLGTLARAAPADSDSGKNRSDVIMLFDPFTLTRIAVVPDRPANQPVLLGSRVGNNGNGNNGNGNGKRPPVIPPRPPVRSPCRPPNN